MAKSRGREEPSRDQGELRDRRKTHLRAEALRQPHCAPAGTSPSPNKSRSPSTSASPLWSPCSWPRTLPLDRPARGCSPPNAGCAAAREQRPIPPGTGEREGDRPTTANAAPLPQPGLCSPRGPAPSTGRERGRGGSARGTHPQTAAGSTAARTAASCSPASARQTQRRCLPEQRAGRSRPRRRQGRGAVGTGAAPPAASLRGRTRQEGADALHEGVGLTRRVLLQRLRRHRQHGRTGAARPAPPRSPRLRTHRVFGGHAVLHPPQPEVHHHGAVRSRSAARASRTAPSGAAMAEPSGPFRVLRDGPDRYLCYCRPAPGPGSAVTV